MPGILHKMKHIVTNFYDKYLDKNLPYMKNIWNKYTKSGNIMHKISKKSGNRLNQGSAVASGTELRPPYLSDEFLLPVSNFVILGKSVAPLIRGAVGVSTDDSLVALVLEGHDPEQIADMVGARTAELTVRLVELRTGPLGCIRPAADDPVSGPFTDVKLRRSRLYVPAKQKPVLSLVARVFGHRLQRLGDRLYLGGQETTLPSLVRLAREGGARIRYPRIDPMDGAWNVGPSRQEPRAADTVDALQPGWLQ